MQTIDHKKGNSALGFIATVVLAAVVIGLLVFVFQYFRSASKDILAKDVKVEILTQGQGMGAREGDTVVVDYVGTLKDGSEFDNSYKRGEPFTVIIGERRVILGWEKGLLGIKQGEKRRLIIPPALAYGEQGIPDLVNPGSYVIPPDSTLYFTIEAREVTTHGYLR